MTGPPPLHGLRVLDLGRVLSGPVCALTLAQLGAEVIRVERPGGDFSWQVPPFLGPDGAVHDGPPGPRDIAIGHAKRDRGKRSVVLDYATEPGRSAFVALARTADVLVENFRPGVMERLGLGHAELSAANPRLVYCAISGYGQSGPYRDQHGMDLLVQASSGALAKTGFADGPPVKAGYYVGDHLAAVYAALAVVAALRRRDRTGVGEYVDVSMFDVMVNLLWDEPLDLWEDAGHPQRTGSNDPRGAPVDVYPTADGWLAVMATSPQHFTRLCGVLGRADLADRFPSIAARVAHVAEVDAAVAGWVRGRTTDEAYAALRAADVPVAPVRPPWAGRHDPHVRARETLRPVAHVDAPHTPAPCLSAGLPFRFAGGGTLDPAVAEPLGASTAAVLGGDGAP